MRRMAGLDLDGWRDTACRGWRIDGEASPDSYAELVEGGHASVIVDGEAASIGGPQAVHSPIGRGAGWGQVGRPTKRRPLASVWSGLLNGEDSPSRPGDLRAAADALIRQAQDVVVCMPDRPQMDERRQQALLSALTGAKRPRVTLLWRPVAMLLGWLETAEGRLAQPGMRVACLQHASDGFEIQYLTLRSLPSDGDLLTPERAGLGQVIAPDLGLLRLQDAADLEMSNENGLTPTAVLGRPRLPDDQLFAVCPAPQMEVFRLESAEWRLLRPPPAGVLSGYPDPVSGMDGYAADIVLLSSPLAPRHHGWLRAAWAKLPGPMHIVDPGTSARGALQAARRIARGAPHYLDRLDQVALVVLRQGEPVFEDLIPANAIVAANREYVSQPITNLVWGRGMASAQFFLRKGGQETRRWTTPEVPAPDGEERLIIQLRQRPAQGWADLTISSRDWDYLSRSPIRLDWMKLEQESRSEEEILASLRRPRPTVPDRVHQPPGMLPWNGMPGREGLASLLKTFDLRHDGNLARLSQAIRWNPRMPDGSRVRAIGTDGDLPPELSLMAQFDLQRVIESLAAYLERHVSTGRGLASNDVLLALTWMYERCPAEVVRELVCAVNCALDGRDHVFLTATASTTVVMHGAGRVIREASDLLQLIPQTLEWLVVTNSINNGLGLLASMLSRPKLAPKIMAEIGVDYIASMLHKIFQRLVKEKIAGSRLKYTLTSIVGLLRVRECDPWALVVERSAWASSFVDIITNEMNYLHQRRSAAIQESKEEIVKMLLGTGGRADLFSVIENIED